MKKFVFLFCTALFSLNLNAQDSANEGIEQACYNYIDGFYQGDTTLLMKSVSPDLLKFGYWKDKETGNYVSEGQMTYDEAITYSRNVLEKKRFVSPEAPRKVEVLDVSNHIASAKVTAWWGIDYMLLAKEDGQWMIKQVLWEGPLK